MPKLKSLSEAIDETIHPLSEGPRCELFVADSAGFPPEECKPPQSAHRQLDEIDEIARSLESLAARLETTVEAGVPIAGEELRAEIRALRTVRIDLRRQFHYEALLASFARQVAVVPPERLAAVIVSCLSCAGPLLGASRLTFYKVGRSEPLFPAAQWKQQELHGASPQLFEVAESPEVRNLLTCLGRSQAVAVGGAFTCPEDLHQRLALLIEVEGYFAWPLIVDGVLSGVLFAEVHKGGTPWRDDASHWLDLCGQIFESSIGRENLANGLFEERQRSKLALSSISDAVYTTGPDGLIFFANPAAEALAGVSLEQIVGRPFEDVLNLSSEDKPIFPVRRILSEHGQSVVMERVSAVNGAGVQFDVECFLSPLMGRTGEVLGAVAVLHDCTEAAELCHIVEYQSAHDALTGLLNRFSFELRIQELLSQPLQSELQHVLILVDLDGFKPVNDLMGHIAGDALLRHVARVLNSHCRAMDLVGRLAGDEFGILFVGCTVEAALKRAEQIVHGIAGISIPSDAQSIGVGASVGVVLLDDDYEDATSALLQADEACFRAKAAGGNRVVVHDPGYSAGGGQRNWHAFLRRVLGQPERICLYAQPIAELTEAPIGPPRFELLLRLRDDDGSLLPPAAFMPAAERYKLMVDLDRGVLKKACEVYSSTASDVQVCFNINLSGPSLGDTTFHSYCREQLAFYSIPAGAFCFEVTESLAVSNMGAAVAFMREMRADGHEFALDDFGAGVSSFRYLKGFPIDCVKIDGAFVKDIVGNPISREIVRSINDISHVLGLKTVAEFVEDEDIKEALRDLEVDGIQGYLIARPRPVESVLAELGHITSG